jgi:hypothetical protein
MESYERVARWGYKRGKPGQELNRLHHSVSLSAPWLADGVRHSAVGQYTQALEAQRGAGALAKKPLPAFTIAPRNDDARVRVEAA